ncbi:MarR family winged helix-turn-helix transcriptional regulator [Paenibacillus mendelii]|uniref:MarR family winged helix-turn-helix transcriptional regulator n=1 Tax=Paenibacillus mendelii TaxID=206163 RepID=A0ABV6J2E7_9BACL|nr:MarR family transcriptional regulator [Paenibacillus mendelii]MCQ6563296.1 MarR family winged helix-turn-helix transcriptional regulator [Paenibacillus mendelii]
MVNTQQTIEVYNSFFSIARRLIKLNHQSAASLGLTVHQIGILNAVRTDPGLTQKEVTERLVFAKSRVSTHIESLVEKGLVSREVSETDRRETKLFITQAGNDLCLQYNEEAVSYKALGVSLQQFSQEEIASLLRMHEHLLNQLSE